MQTVVGHGAGGGWWSVWSNEQQTVNGEERRIARLVLVMDLRDFEVSSDASHQEEIELEHNVRDGFIVTVVYDDSIAWRLNISQGDIIVSYSGPYDFTLHKFNGDYLQVLI
ncbi:hypothetical protein GUJ93_ZPchr0014g46554 [Zizania palustris]|uniref:Uncharacterized protein n=1 Tax=Zizania palustris TaxID=103762 RepID=A0A8J5SXK4_ZIZPA|nr:hypothetical protein GUJ93_ZPchr0014g46554 [Zizania palustris]